MTNTDTVNGRWERELSRFPRREDGSRELRQFHTAAGTAAQGGSRSRHLSQASTLALAVGNGAVMGAGLGSLFGTAAGVVSGAIVSLVGYAWISGDQNKDK
jgi:hypothetical protein